MPGDSMSFLAGKRVSDGSCLPAPPGGIRDSWDFGGGGVIQPHPGSSSHQPQVLIWFCVNGSGRVIEELAVSQSIHLPSGDLLEGPRSSSLTPFQPALPGTACNWLQMNLKRELSK